MPRTPRKIRLGDSAFQVEWNAMVDYVNFLTPPADSRKKKQEAIAPNQASISATIRGEYLSSVTYQAGHMVVIPTGANAGTYVCVKDNPGAGNPPWVGGGYWLKLFSGNALGQWM